MRLPASAFFVVAFTTCAVAALSCNAGSCGPAGCRSNPAPNSDRCVRWCEPDDAPCCRVGPATQQTVSFYRSRGWLPVDDCFTNDCFDCPTPDNPCPQARNASVSPPSAPPPAAAPPASTSAAPPSQSSDAAQLASWAMAGARATNSLRAWLDWLVDLAATPRQASPPPSSPLPSPMGEIVAGRA